MRTFFLSCYLLVSCVRLLKASDAPQEKILLTAKYSDDEVVTLSERELTAAEVEELNKKSTFSIPMTGGRISFWKKVNERTKESVLLHTLSRSWHGKPGKDHTYHDMQVINDVVITLVKIYDSQPEAVIIPVNGKGASQHLLRIETEFSGALTGPTRGVRTIGGKIVDFKAPILTVDLESYNINAKKRVDRVEIDITKKLEVPK